MQIEEINLKFYRFRDNNNQPTCAVSFIDGLVCHFYDTFFFGTQELCTHQRETLFRREDGTGTLIPLNSCPLWNDHENN